MTTTETPSRRTFLQWLFRGGLGRPLVNLWVEARSYGGYQRITETRLKLGRYTLLRWEKITLDLDAFDRL